jgi:hypothetical protein
VGKVKWKWKEEANVDTGQVGDARQEKGGHDLRVLSARLKMRECDGVYIAGKGRTSHNGSGRNRDSFVRRLGQCFHERDLVISDDYVPGAKDHLLL